MAVNIGPKIGIDGYAEYRKQINGIIQETKTLESEYKKISSTFDQNTSSIKKNEERRKYLTEQIKINSERVKANQQVLDEAAKKHAELEQALAKASSEYGENSKEAETLRKQLEKLDQDTVKWTQNTNNATAELNKLETELRNLPSKMTLVGEKMQDVGSKIKDAGQHMTDFGRTIMPVSTAAAGALTAAGKAFMDFEAGMSKVSAISGATGDDLDKLTEKAKEMGATTKFSATESADAFTYMAMAGWKTEDMLAGIAPVMNLAAASGEELGTVSDIVTDALTAFGLKAEDAGHFADVLAAASSNANTNVSMMGESFKYAAPVAGSLGYSIEDVAVALGLMANSGIKADMAGTSLRNMLNRMAKPTKESAMAMERLGLELADDEGKMYSLRDIMGQMRTSFKNINMPVEEFNRQVNALTQSLDDGEISEKDYEKELEELAKQAYGAEGAEKARAAAMLGGTRAMSAMLAIANASEEDYEKLTAAVDGSSQAFARLADGSIVPLNEALQSGQEIMETYSGTAEEMAKIMEENSQGAWTKAKSAMESAGIAAGEVLAPHITKAAGAVQDLANWFSSLDSETQETIVKTAALVAAAGPAIMLGGKAVSGIGSLVSGGGQLVSMLGSLAPAAATAGGSMSGMAGGAASAAGSLGAIAAPAGIAVAAVALLGAAFVTAYQQDEEFAQEVNTSWGGIKKTITETIDVIKPAWEKFSKTIAPVFTAGMDSVQRRLEIFKTYAQGFINVIGGIFNGDWKRVIEGAKQIAASSANLIVEKFRTMRDAIQGIFSKMNIQLPHIKLPHFVVEGQDRFGLPKLRIDWYQKAMQGGMKLDRATIFGMANGKYLGGGEAGNEWIVGENSLMGMIRAAVDSAGGHGDVSIGDTTIVINAADGQNVYEIAEAVDEIINARYQQAEAAWA